MCQMKGTVAKRSASADVPVMSSLRMIFLAALIGAPSHVLAGASDWHRVAGASIRFVTEGAPDASGMLRGALEVALEPGWKTYWRDPGASGVPPALEVRVGDQAAKVTIDYPAPRRFDVGDAAWAGYDGPVSFALTLQLPAGSTGSHVVADAFLGVCETICIPVQAELSVPLTNETDHALTVARAFAALPAPADARFGLRLLTAAADDIVVEAVVPAGVEVLDLFVAGTEAVLLGTPHPKQADDGAVRFAVPVLRGTGEAGEQLAYTLGTTTGSISGVLELP